MEINILGTIVAIVVGVYGAILSTFLFIREGRKSRRNVRILCEETIEKWPQDKSVRLLPKYAAITLRAINTSYRPIVIVAAGFTLSNGEKVEKVGDEGGLPQKITDGESIGIPFGIASLENKLTDASAGKRAHRRLRLRSPVKWVGNSVEERLADFLTRGDEISLEDMD